MNKTTIVASVPVLTDVPMTTVIYAGGKQEAALETLTTVMKRRESD